MNFQILCRYFPGFRQGFRQVIRNCRQLQPRHQWTTTLKVIPYRKRMYRPAYSYQNLRCHKHQPRRQWTTTPNVIPYRKRMLCHAFSYQNLRCHKHQPRRQWTTTPNVIPYRKKSTFLIVPLRH